MSSCTTTAAAPPPQKKNDDDDTQNSRGDIQERQNQRQYGCTDVKKVQLLSVEKNSRGHVIQQEVRDDDQQDTTEQSEDSIAAEVQSVGSLKVTIQQRGESREFGRTDRTADRQAGLHCHVCDLTCRSLQLFQVHMLGSEHLKKLQEVTQSICTNAYRLQDRGHHATTQRWCDSCQTHFSGCVITHRRTEQHKMCKQLSRPFCLVCKRHFRTPRKFVEHMKSAEHKQQVRLDEAQDDELITVDAVGCFEGEEEEEEEADVADEEDEENKMLKATASEEAVGEEYDPYQTYGSAFVVPVSGFLCRLCNKFFYGEMTARYTHCRTRAHYMNMQRHTNTDPEGRTRPVPEALTWS
ncbi:cdkn1a interacting zinc finger protein 1b isoform X2 [Betta splendens]|uniref:Cdkn1a interacting zinc finger protein 1b isoform X2 n=1 Tax=Betta splendens TaxID=158456 RepID=A0A6P7ND19_BETSP|nr:cdkn1a interacting zinc finger protein 1b isoform X2 [Betta splendens]